MMSASGVQVLKKTMLQFHARNLGGGNFCASILHLGFGSEKVIDDSLLVAVVDLQHSARGVIMVSPD